MGRRTAERTVVVRLPAAWVKDCPELVRGSESEPQVLRLRFATLRMTSVWGVRAGGRSLGCALRAPLGMTRVWIVPAESRSFGCAGRYCRPAPLRMTSVARVSDSTDHTVRQEMRSALARRAHPSRRSVLRGEVLSCAKDGAPGEPQVLRLRFAALRMTSLWGVRAGGRSLGCALRAPLGMTAGGRVPEALRNSRKRGGRAPILFQFEVMR